MVVCLASGTNGWSDCVRGCLLQMHEANEPFWNMLADHAFCFGVCGELLIATAALDEIFVEGAMPDMLELLESPL